MDKLIILAPAAFIIILIIPVPALVLDILMAVNLLFALLLLIIILNTKKTAKFYLLPTSLLLSTFFGLAVNLLAVRLILTKGADFDGRLIKAVASFAAGFGETGIIISLALFLLLVAIHTIVFVKGCTRVSEVAVRFTLDSMQVKMMAAETEYSSGSISEEEADALKFEIRKESDFYGALDGVSKFISGNEKIRIFIIAVTVIGGILIGTLLRGEAISDAISTYVSLSIGSGFLFMPHGFLLAVMEGIVVTRAAAK